MPDFSPFAPYQTAWQLTPDGEAIKTYSSDLLPVRWQGRAAMLKLTHTEEERTGSRLMVWLKGDGAAHVYAHDNEAIVLERLDTQPSLADMAQQGQDDEATRILCAAVAHLHRPRPTPPPELPTLRRWFRSLERAAPQGGLFGQTWAIAEALLDDPQDVLPLHGDIHHGNVLHSPAAGRGWLALDPKGIAGERGYDYANIFCNPTTDFALSAGRLARQSWLVAGWAGLERPRLLHWIAAYAGLSAAWWLEDGAEAEVGKVLEIAALALAELEQG